MLALEVKNLKKQYENFCLNDVSFNLEKGYILGYIGQNGAGKSTTINLIMDFIKGDGGQIKVFGKTIKDNEIEYKKLIGYVSDECYFLDSMKCADVNKSMKMFYTTYDEGKFKNYLKKWGIKLDSKVKDLSKGMKTKLMLAAVLSRETKLLVLDEPTSGLDPIFRIEILDILQDYIVDGEHSVLFSTHILSDIEKVADYVCFIKDGSLMLNDATNSIIENHFVIKGDTDDLNTIKRDLIYYKTSKYGFEGILKKEKSLNLDNRYLLEQPGIEDIMIGYNSSVEEKTL